MLKKIDNINLTAGVLMAWLVLLAHLVFSMNVVG